MAKEQFHITVDDWAEIHELPDSWPIEQLRQVLELADYDDPVADDEAQDMALMALQDLGVDQASDVVLQVVFNDRMSSGVRQNLIDDLKDDRPWEHVADVDKQAGIFQSVVLLQRAFPTRFGIPDALRLRLSVTATDVETSKWLRLSPPSPSLLLRLLASGMDEDAVLIRLFEEELQADAMPGAEAILWRIEEINPASPTDPASRGIEIHSSWQWLGALEDRETWQGRGWPDGMR